MSENKGDTIPFLGRRRNTTDSFLDYGAGEPNTYDPFAYPETRESRVANDATAEKWFWAFQRKMKRRKMLADARRRVIEFLELVAACYLVQSALVLVTAALKSHTGAICPRRSFSQATPTAILSMST
ncbi:hypothetical protein GOL45_30830 [Sinorhizobium medicae]|nr:hypothetical protein [Sinorhizobium medicae]MDX1066542.1 hypothetical protein [Sinorhizobium medicae]MDX2330270.1 hypothetical protein [Sinorhizobium medicae]